MWIPNVQIQVPDEVFNLSQEFQSPIEELSEVSANYLADAYRFYVVAVGAVDKGELLYSIHVEDGPGFTKWVVASANHGMIVELGWIDRAQGQASYPGRHPAEKAIEFFFNQLESGEIVDALQWRMGK